MWLDYIVWVLTKFYMNAVLDWYFYRMHYEMLQHPTWALRCSKGALPASSPPHLPTSAAPPLLSHFPSPPLLLTSPPPHSPYPQLLPRGASHSPSPPHFPSPQPLPCPPWPGGA